MKVCKETVIRTVVTLLALLNSVLVMLGKNPLPFSDEELYTGISAVVSVITVIWSWWKNNSFTHNAIVADSYLKDLKKTEKKLV